MLAGHLKLGCGFWGGGCFQVCPFLLRENDERLRNDVFAHPYLLDIKNGGLGGAGGLFLFRWPLWRVNGGVV